MIDPTYLTIAACAAALILTLLLVLEIRRQRERRAAAPLLTRGRGPGLGERLRELLRRPELDGTFWSELETTLLEADVGLAVTEKLLAAAQAECTPEAVRRALAESMVAILAQKAPAPRSTPHVAMVLGVNGVGTTTTIAKLARRAQGEGRRVLLAAGDTFRAAAIEQLLAWADRLKCDVVAQAPGADAASVAFDAVERARARGHDLVIIDTAGRLHTKKHLMEELKKVARVADRALAGAPHEKLLVIDATVGSNGLAQAREFHDALSLTGVVVAKLDGTAKGGVVLAIAGELGLPITHVGTGEKLADLQPFDARAFVHSILGSGIGDEGLGIGVKGCTCRP